jgi:hypothetical protein
MPEHLHCWHNGPDAIWCCTCPVAMNDTRDLDPAPAEPVTEPQGERGGQA